MIAYFAVTAVVVTPLVGLVIRMRHYAGGGRREWIEAALGMLVLGLLFVAIEAWTIIAGAVLAPAP